MTASQKFWVDIDILSKLKGYRQKLTILPPGWGYLWGRTENRRIKPNRLGLILSNNLNSTIPFRLGLMKIKTELRQQANKQNPKTVRIQQIARLFLTNFTATTCSAVTSHIARRQVSHSQPSPSVNCCRSLRLMSICLPISAALSDIIFV